MTWLLSGLLAGIWAAVLAIPAWIVIAAALAAFVVSRLSGPWKPLGTAVALPLLVAGGFLWGHHVADREAELAAAARDLAIARTARADAEVKAEAQQIYAQSLEKQVQDYATELSSRVPPAGSPPGVCALDADDLRALERLR